MIGTRYKCAVCKDFDYCEKCEAKNDHEHCMLKIKRPEQCPKAIFTIIGDDVPELPAFFGEAEIDLTDKETEALMASTAEAWGCINPADQKMETQEQQSLEPAIIKTHLDKIIKLN